MVTTTTQTDKIYVSNTGYFVIEESIYPTSHTLAGQSMHGNDDNDITASIRCLGITLNRRFELLSLPER